MEEIFVFLGILVAGLVVFFVVFMKEKKEETSAGSLPLSLGGGLGASSLAPSQDKPESSQEALLLSDDKQAETKWEDAPAPVQEAPVFGQSSGGVEEAVTKKLDEKCAKLEKILEEKNQILARLEEDLKREQSMRGEFDSLRNILQEQIDDLKNQNKTLKEEIAQVLKENLELQSQLGVASTDGSLANKEPYVTAEPSLGEKPADLSEEPEAAADAPPQVSLPGPLANEKKGSAILDEDEQPGSSSKEVDDAES